MSRGTAGEAPPRLDLGDRIRAAMAPRGSRSALSARVAVLYLPVSVASQLIDAAGYGGPLVLRMAATAVAFAVLIGGLAIARRLVAPRRSQRFSGPGAASGPSRPR